MTDRKARRESAGRQLEAARSGLAAVVVELKEIVVEDARDGVPEAVIARDLGVTRATVRAWLGKSSRRK